MSLELGLDEARLVAFFLDASIADGALSTGLLSLSLFFLATRGGSKFKSS